MKPRPVGTRSFLVMWYVMMLGVGALWSALVEYGLPGWPDLWVFHMFIWIAVGWLLLVGNHMATGSWVLRGLRDWP